METHDTQSKKIRSWKTIGEVASFMIICGFLIQVTDPSPTPEKLNGCWKSTINGRTMYVNFVSNTQADLFLVENGTLVACERCAYISSFWDYSIQFYPCGKNIKAIQNRREIIPEAVE